MIHRCGLAVARGYERALQPIEMSPVETGVLMAVAYSGPNHVRGLARLLGVGRQTIVNTTKRLQAVGLLAASSNENDARLLQFSITRLGRRKLVQVEQIASHFDQQLRELVGQQNEADMVQKLQHIAEAPFLAYED